VGGVEGAEAELGEHAAEGDARARFGVLAPARAVESSRPREQAAEAGGDAGEEGRVAAALVVALAHRLAQGVGGDRPVEVDAALPEPVVELAAAQGLGRFLRLWRREAAARGAALVLAVAVGGGAGRLPGLAARALVGQVGAVARRAGEVVDDPLLARRGGSGRAALNSPSCVPKL